MHIVVFLVVLLISLLRTGLKWTRETCASIRLARQPASIAACSQIQMPSVKSTRKLRMQSRRLLNWLILRLRDPSDQIEREWTLEQPPWSEIRRIKRPVMIRKKKNRIYWTMSYNCELGQLWVYTREKDLCTTGLLENKHYNIIWGGRNQFPDHIWQYESISFFGTVWWRRSFALLFWNQILIWRSERLSFRASSVFLFMVMYLLMMNSLSSSLRCVSL